MIPLPTLYWWVMAAAFAGGLLALVLVVDDAVQHLVEGLDVEAGRPPRPDWSPVHRAYVAVARWLEREA